MVATINRQCPCLCTVNSTVLREIRRRESLATISRHSNSLGPLQLIGCVAVQTTFMFEQVAGRGETLVTQ